METIEQAREDQQSTPDEHSPGDRTMGQVYEAITLDEHTKISTPETPSVLQNDSGEREVYDAF